MKSIVRILELLPGFSDDLLVKNVGSFVRQRSKETSFV